jgi:hypothetical protein
LTIFPVYHVGGAYDYINAFRACEKLCGVAGLDFKPPSIAVAGADSAALKRETERIEHEGVHRI